MQLRVIESAMTRTPSILSKNIEYDRFMIVWPFLSDTMFRYVFKVSDMSISHF